MVTCIRVFLYVVLNLLIITSAEILQRDVCLERAISFVREYHEDGLCSVFYESNVKEFFPEGTTATCHVPCQIKIDYWKNYWHYIYSVALEFDGYNYSTKTGCTTSTKAQISIDCTRWRKNQLGIIWSNECTESHADCSRWYGFCICHCKSGYFMNNGRCLPGNIQLNQTCTTTDQCSGSPYASCLGGRCSCIEGYDASNSSDCVLGHQIDTHAIVQTDNSVKSARINLVPLLGALLGGLLLGVVITVIVGYILHRRFCSDIEQRKEHQVMFSKKNKHNRSRNDDINQEETHVHHDKQKTKRGSVNGSPPTRSEESPEYSNVSGKKNAMKANEDVYNHLNEKEETQNEDTYDHACAASISGHMIEFGDYGNHPGLGDDFAISSKTETDDYSTLEQH